MKIKILLFVVLGVIYLALARKNPFGIDSYISDMSPGPDTFYYSVPAWNWVHGQGFKLMSYGKEIKQMAPPLYGVFLAPFFLIFKDIRVYYYGNLLLGLISIWLFVRLVDKFYENSPIKYWITGATGLILVTNYYFYNLPSLLMAENPLITMTLLAANVLVEKYSFKNLVVTGGVMVLLMLTKASGIPVVGAGGLVTLSKIKWQRSWFSLKNLIILALLITGTIVFLWIVIGGLTKNFYAMVMGGGFLSAKYFSSNFRLYVTEFVGVNGHYLGSVNQQIENVAGWLAVGGIVIGLMFNEYRRKVLSLLTVILAVITFHSFMYYPEGRYISTVIPLFIAFWGIGIDALGSRRNKLVGIGLVIMAVGIYLGVYQTINGHRERKLTSLNRQLLNNSNGGNGLAENYVAVSVVNNYLSKRQDKPTTVVMLLSPFYVSLFGNGNYNYLPLSPSQDFMDKTRGYEGQFIPDGVTFNEYYKRLLNSGEVIYVSNHYALAVPKWKEDFEELKKSFTLTEVATGCHQWCNLYKLDLKKK